ncbi:pyruvate kinase [Cupriavidus sp. P-10]|uniref:pyruvate kinase n=1 Tax=Cupriavidus sp. P-10 TaxID=2027911 RepID=UPI000E2E602D|nr:pyruvate kinase [Cupriavidus sp. P-10]BDB27292.1 pyruvate kinase [Cupriavidus sp. P-10]
MRRYRKAKIVATLGPATSSVEAIRSLFLAGADVFRFNFSHGSHETHQQNYAFVRQIERETGRPIAVLAELQGPKLRIGLMGEATTLVEGSEFVLDRSPQPGDARRVGLPHQELFDCARPGKTLLIDDGKLQLRVQAVAPDRMVTTVVTGGILSSRKGVNVPDAVIPIPALTEKDIADLEFALTMGVDWVALSFVQTADDVIAAKTRIAGRATVVAKLEKPAAVEHLEQIARQADAVMVARGDLGVELPPERVPAVQKRISRVCRQLGRPVIVATQMLESMIAAPVPTRAEASDVASAIYDGVDAVMLSAESASGRYPREAVQMMDRIIREVEADPLYRNMIDAQQVAALSNRQDAVCGALRDITRIVGANTTIAYTSSGATTSRAARVRPQTPIVGITPSLEVARRMCLTWGVHAAVVPDVKDVDEMITVASNAALNEGFAEDGEEIVIVAGMPFGRHGSTNMLHVARVAQAQDVALSGLPASKSTDEKVTA